QFPSLLAAFPPQFKDGVDEALHVPGAWPGIRLLLGANREAGGAFLCVGHGVPGCVECWSGCFARLGGQWLPYGTNTHPDAPLRASGEPEGDLKNGVRVCGQHLDLVSCVAVGGVGKPGAVLFVYEVAALRPEVARGFDRPLVRIVDEYFPVAHGSS